MLLAVRPIQNHHWVVSIILIVLILLVIVRWNKSNYMVSFLNSLLSSEFYSKKFSEKKRIELPEVLVFVASLLSISFFLFVITHQDHFSIVSYFQILLIVTVLLLSKYFIEKIIGDLFQLDQLLGKYLFFKQGVLSWIGIFFLFPVSLIFYFQSIENSLLFTLMVGVSIGVYVFKLFWFVGLHQKYILPYSFYFILYLCAFEIAPYLILFKFLKIN